MPFNLHVRVEDRKTASTLSFGSCSFLLKDFRLHQFLLAHFFASVAGCQGNIANFTLPGIS